MDALLCRKTREELDAIVVGQRWGDWMITEAGPVEWRPHPSGSEFTRRIHAELALPCCITCRQPIHETPEEDSRHAYQA